MPEIPRDYDPRSPKLPRPHVKYDLKRGILSVSGFGRRVLPPVPPHEMFEPICGSGCRLDDCGEYCRLTARQDKEEPEWKTAPTNS